MRVENQGFQAIHEPRATAFRVFMKHGTRITKHGFIRHKTKGLPKPPETQGRAATGFLGHETRNKRRAFDQARGASKRKFRAFHETRNTRHEPRISSFFRGLNGACWY